MSHPATVARVAADIALRGRRCQIIEYPHVERATALGISESSVARALRRLAAEGQIRVVPGIGHTPTQVTIMRP